MKKYEEMSIEELREQIVKKDEQLKNLKDVNNVFEESLKIKDEEINGYLEDIKELKLKNYDLFVQIPKGEVIPPKDEPVEDDTINILDLTNNLIERMED